MRIVPRIKRTSLNLDLDLVAQARDVLDTRTMTDTIHRALDEVIAREALRKLAAWRPDYTLEELEQFRRQGFGDSDVEW